MGYTALGTNQLGAHRAVAKAKGRDMCASRGEVKGSTSNARMEAAASGNG